jgi:hypothetical protein
MVLLTHRAPQVREHRHDHGAAACLADLCEQALAESVPVGHNGLDTQSGAVCGAQASAGDELGCARCTLVIAVEEHDSVVA